MAKFDDLTGQRFGYLTVVEMCTRERKQKDKKGRHVVWKQRSCNCKCDCGKKVNVFKYDLVSGHVKSCGCKKQCNDENKLLSLHFNAVYNDTFSIYKRNADKRGLSFDLTFDQFKELITKKCHYCGALYSIKSGKKATRSVCNGIDRIDSSKGYTLDNCRTCCRKCNTAKMDQPDAEFLEWIDKAYNWLHREDKKEIDIIVLAREDWETEVSR